jgi:hypothetical protein
MNGFLAKHSHLVCRLPSAGGGWTGRWEWLRGKGIHGHDRAPMRPGLVVVRHYRLFMLTPIDEVPLGARRLAIASCRCSAPTGEAPTLLCFSRVFEKLIGENC